MELLVLRGWSTGIGTGDFCELTFGLPCSREGVAVTRVELRGDVAGNADAGGCRGGVGLGLRDGRSRYCGLAVGALFRVTVCDILY